MIRLKVSDQPRLPAEFERQGFAETGEEGNGARPAILRFDKPWAFGSFSAAPTLQIWPRVSSETRKVYVVNNVPNIFTACTSSILRPGVGGIAAPRRWRMG
jgi:hypothetical protein